jgi:hypothetical protein
MSRGSTRRGGTTISHASSTCKRPTAGTGNPQRTQLQTPPTSEAPNGVDGPQDPEEDEDMTSH